MPIAIAQSLSTALRQPLSKSQQEIWYAAQVSDAASAAFNQSFVLELNGVLDTNALSHALDALVLRHDALRTSFSPIGDEQEVHADLPLFCPVVDLSDRSSAEQNERVQTRLRGEVQTPFDLTKGPMLRAVLLKLGPTRYLLVLTAHHVVCDGTSVNLLIQHLAELYSARRMDPDFTTLPEPAPVQFSEFIAHQLELEARNGEAEQYWIQQYATPAPFVDLPFDRPRPKVRSFKGGGGYLRFDQTVAQDFRRMAARNRCTLFAASLATFHILLHRLSGQTDLVVGVPMSARSTEGSHSVIGHCVNFLPLRLSIAGNPTFTEHLTHVRGMLLDALDHVNYNFGSLIRKLNLPRHPTRAPLVSTMFNVDHVQTEFELEGLELNVVPNPYCLTNFDFSLSLEDHQGTLEARCLYSADMLEAATISRWLHHLETLMRGAVANPQARIGELTLLTPAEQKIILSSSGTEEHLIHELLPPDLAALTRPGTPDLEMYVLDGYGQLGVPGVVGELCIAGLPLIESKVPVDRLTNVPWGENDGHLLFRTGYKAKYLATGEIEILDPVRVAEPAAVSAAETSSVPDSEIQSTLTQIWREIMCLEVIEPGDDFFDLGGHSLLIMQIVTRIRQSFGVELSLRDFFKAATIADMTRLIEAHIVGDVERMSETHIEHVAAETLVAN